MSRLHSSCPPSPWLSRATPPVRVPFRPIPHRPCRATSPLVIGETFTIDSRILGETRRINVYLPPGHAGSPSARLPVLYMPDGGIAEDFLHVAGLVQVSVGNGTMRPFLLVGIENTERRRDMTGPTENEEDKKIAPRVGGSAAFRGFLREELMPQVKARYRTTDETAIVGESLAGLFVVETFLLEPDLFDTYIAFDPSLWWNDRKLVDDAAERLRARPKLEKTLYLASSDEQGIVEGHAAVRGRPREECAARRPLALREDAGGEALDDLPSGRAQSVPRGVQAAQGRGAGSAVAQGSRRWTRVAVAWSRGRTTISSMLTCGGRVTAQTMQSATSSAVSGVMPR